MAERQGTTHLRLGNLYYAVSWNRRDATEAYLSELMRFLKGILR
jgi:hypothetical protein